MKKKYKLFSKQWFKEFNKQSDEDKRKLMEVIIAEMVNKALRTAYTDSVITGMHYRVEALYERYVQQIDKLDSSSEEWSTLVSRLLSEIRVSHIAHEKMKKQKEELVFGKSEVSNGED